MPAGLGHPPARRARASRSPPSTWSPSTSGPRPRRRRPAGAARPRLRGRPGAHRAPARPGPGGARPVARRRSAPTPTCSSRWSRHRGPDDAARAARMLGFAADERRHRGAHQRRPLRRPRRRARPPTCSTPSRRLVALDARHVDRVNAEGYLKSGKEMARGRRARSPRAAGLDERAARRLLAATRRVADRCAVDPRADLGIGEVHFPELDVLDGDAGRRRRADGAARALRGRARPPGDGRATRAVRQRLDDELDGHRARSATRRTSSPSPTSST